MGFRLQSSWPFPLSHIDFSLRVVILGLSSFPKALTSSLNKLLHIFPNVFRPLQLKLIFISPEFLLNYYLTQSFLMSYFWPCLGH